MVSLGSGFSLQLLSLSLSAVQGRRRGPWLTREIVNYRDHPPQDHSYVTQVLPLEHDIRAVQTYLQGLHGASLLSTLRPTLDLGSTRCEGPREPLEQECITDDGSVRRRRRARSGHCWPRQVSDRAGVEAACGQDGGPHRGCSASRYVFSVVSRQGALLRRAG